MMDPQTKRSKSKAGQPGKVTPMMAQYLAIREGLDDALLFYRMGDFYELFFDDAKQAAEALDIALTKRGQHLGEDIPMCGVPVHSANAYLQRLIGQGFKVAVCEQTEDPAEAKKRGAKSVVNREMVRLVTPGTLSEDSLLAPDRANRLAALAQTAGGDAALAWADISTGEFAVQEFVPPDALHAAREMLAGLSASELLVSDNLTDLPQQAELLCTPLPASSFKVTSAAETRLSSHFGAAGLDSFGQFNRAGKSALIALFGYVELTQAGAAPRLHPPQLLQSDQFLRMDPATRHSLELVRSQSGSRKGSLLASIDRTVTAPGARLLADRLSRPFAGLERIHLQLDAVQWLADRPQALEALREILQTVPDLQRVFSRLQLGRGGPRDLRQAASAILAGERVNAGLLDLANTGFATALEQALEAVSLAKRAGLAEVVRDIGKAFIETPPVHDREGGFVAKDWNPKLDELRELRDHSRRAIAALQGKYAQSSGVQSLKVKHNNVLGYFVEVTPRNADALMDEDGPFRHRQTLGSAVRFTTQELSGLESEILSAADKTLALEREIYAGLLQRLQQYVAEIRDIASALAELDVLQASAIYANDKQCCHPKVEAGGAFHIVAGRHPVVEDALLRDGGQVFTPNDCALGDAHETGARLTLVTGPNMAGKSTWLRQNALMVVMAQAGLFVPAREARIGLADRVFSRVGASDDLARGRSTFMVEMTETAAILHQSTEQSFVILDEIGRGTATWDGLAIAWAVTEHLQGVNKSRVLFATHYHELTGLAGELPGVANVSLRAKEFRGDLIFLHEVAAGAADRSYGIQVARLSGLPALAVSRAGEVLSRLEAENHNVDHMDELPLFAARVSEPVTPKKSAVEERLAAASPDEMSPREALEFLYALRELMDGKSS